MSRGSPPSTLKPKTGKEPGGAQADTDPNEGGFKTVVFGPPVALPTKGPRKNPNDELVDFLAPPQALDELGRLGSYRILRVIGAGGMGVVYEAEDTVLERRVALKAMLPTLAVSLSARQRFLREARAAAAVEHARIVQIYQVGEERGVPFLVMPMLKGESLEDRFARAGRPSFGDAMRIAREIAEALAAAHERGLIHRDIKPGNVWLEGAKGSVKLLDFGLARAIETDTPLTQQGSIVGTPAFMAPEQATGDAIDARSDLFSLGCVLYRMCTGTLPFDGSNAVATLMAIVGKEPTPPREIDSGIPIPLSDLILRLLAKKPTDRPATAQEVIATLDSMPPPPAEAAGAQPLPGQSNSTTEKLSAEIPKRPPPSGTAPAAAADTPPRSRASSILLVAAVLAIILGGAVLVVRPLLRRDNNPPGPIATPAPVKIGIAYGTEKQKWLNEAVVDFAEAPEGKNIKINLIPMGSLEGGKAVSMSEDQRIHVWSPASSLYKAAIVHDWQIKHADANPVLKEESLALTPLVFVMWKDRCDAFLAKYKTISFPAVIDAMQQKDGWGGIAGRPDWGRFRFGHTIPTQSNSGLMTLVVIAYDLNTKDKDLTRADIARPEFQTELETLTRGLAGTSNSTGNLMKDMVAKGPSAYDALVVYESIAIDYLKAARGRWGDLCVVYPRRNLWSENPYYILDVPWSSKEQRQAAETFLGFLLSEPQQKKALSHGFRPANINVPIMDNPESPFVHYKSNGLTVSLGAVCDPPSREVIDDLLLVWGRSK